MTMVAIPGGLWIHGPPYPWGAAAPAYATTLVMDATAEKVAGIFQVPKTGTLDKVELRLGAVTSFGGGSVLRLSFQDVSLTTGDPDGTQDQFRDVTTGVTSNAWLVPGLMTSDGTDGGSKRVVTAGDRLSWVVEFQTFTAADALAIAAIDTVANASYLNEVYNDHFTASWAKSGTQPVMALKYNDGTYEYIGGCSPYAGMNTVSFSSTSTPDERGLIFQFPWTVQISAVYLRLDLDADADFVLYDSNGTSVMTSKTMDSNVRGATLMRNTYLKYAAAQTHLSNTAYRAVVKPLSASDVTLADMDVASTAIMNALEGGQTWHYTQRTDAGAWTETTTKRPAIGFLVTAIDIPSGGPVGQSLRGGFVN